MALELVCHVLCLLKKQSVLNITAIFFALTMWTLTRHLFWLAIVLACVTFVQLADTGNDDGFHLIVLLVSAFGLLAHEFIVIQKDLLEYTHTHTHNFLRILLIVPPFALPRSLSKALSISCFYWNFSIMLCPGNTTQFPLIFLGLLSKISRLLLEYLTFPEF